MFTAVAHKSLAGAEGYFVEHLSQNDYYAAGEIRPGQWIGIGAERLGLRAGQHVTREQFYALCENQHPQTGERLTLRQNEKDRRRVFFDFTCSPARFGCPWRCAADFGEPFPFSIWPIDQHPTATPC
jgi:hypothetical protein